MAKNVTVTTLGGRPQIVEVNTVQEAMEALNLSGSYTAKVNGNSAELSETLDDYSFVSFSEKVKGGNQ